MDDQSMEIEDKRIEELEREQHNTGQRLSTLEESVRGIGRDVGRLTENFATFTRDYVHQQRTPWATLISAAAFVLMLSGTYATMMVGPIVKDIIKLDTVLQREMRLIDETNEVKIRDVKEQMQVEIHLRHELSKSEGRAYVLEQLLELERIGGDSCNSQKYKSELHL